MKLHQRIILAACVLLLLGVTTLAVRSTRNAARLGREAATAQAEAEALRQKLKEPVVGRLPPATGLDDDVWRARVNDLQARLAEKDREIASLQVTADSPAASETDNTSTNAPEERRRGRRDRGAWLEEIKTSDPERYAAIQERRKEAREKMERSIAEQADFYLNRDTASMKEDEFAEYERMLGMLDETWLMAEQMQANLPREERRTIRRTMRDNMQELEPMMDTERDREFYQLGLDFGYTESEAQEFTDYLNGVIEVTSMSALYEGMYSGRRGGGGSSSPGGSQR